MAKKAASPAAKPMSQSEVINSLAESTNLSKKDVKALVEALSELIGKQIGKKGPGVFTIPGLCKIQVKVKEAQPARKHQWVPLLKEYRDIPAKPAKKLVKVSAVKKLKDMAQ